MLNKVLLQGRLCSDIKPKQIGKESIVANVTLAVQRDKEHTDFIRCSIFNRTCELMYDYLKKGDMVIVEGSLNVTQKDDATYTQVNVTSFQFCGSTTKQDEPKQDEPKQEFKQTTYKRFK